MTFPIVYILDDNYWFPVLVSAKSALLMFDSSEYKLEFILIANAVREDHKENIRKELSTRVSLVRFVDPDMKLYENLPTHHGTKLIWSRCVINKLLPDVYGWVCVCDGDTLWLRSPLELFSVVRDYGDDVIISGSNDCHQPGYFCMGFAMMHLGRVLAFETERKSEEYLTKNGVPPLNEQDIFNDIFAEHKRILPRGWGAFPVAGLRQIPLDEVGVVHFVGSLPWPSSYKRRMMDIQALWWFVASEIVTAQADSNRFKLSGGQYPVMRAWDFVLRFMPRFLQRKLRLDTESVKLPLAMLKWKYLLGEKRGILKCFFIDFEFHRLTGSSAFFKDILRKRFLVQEHYSNGARTPEMCTPADVADSDVVLNWQMAPTMFDAWRYKKPLVFLPMYDGETFNPIKWYRRALLGASAICFSKVLYKRLMRFGMKAIYVKYYTQPQAFCPGSPRKLFFWARNGVTFDMLKPFINKDSFDEIVVRYSEQMPHPIRDEDICDYHIRVIDAKQLKTRKEYYEIFKDCGVFVAPRLKEGIGLSFIEAMSMGKCVIAHDDSTMNEYITNGVNGILVNLFGRPRQLDLTERRISSMQRNAYESCVKGYAEWVAAQNATLDFIEENIRSFRPMGGARRMLWFMLCPCQFIVNVRTYLRLRFGV